MGKETSLKDREKEAVQVLLLPPTENTPSSISNSSSTQPTLSFAQQIKSKISIPSQVPSKSQSKASRYRSTLHVSPTSNDVERLFSMSKRTMSDVRKHMGPESLEATLMLRLNLALWIAPYGPRMIQEVINSAKAEKNIQRKQKQLEEALKAQSARLTSSSLSLHGISSNSSSRSQSSILMPPRTQSFANSRSDTLDSTSSFSSTDDFAGSYKFYS